MTRAARFLVAALALLACACGGRKPVVEFDELPEQPIAFVFLDPQKARDLAERLQKNKQDQAQARTPGVARLDDVAKVLRLGDQFAASDLLGRPSLLHPRTGEVEPLEALPRGARPLEWSADRLQLLFAAPRFDVFQVSRVNVATGEVRTLTQGEEDHPSASLAPDGTLAFSQLLLTTAERAGSSRILVRSPGGGEPRPVSAGPGDASPVWSRDGAALLYQTELPDGNLGIALLESLDGSPRIVARGRDPVVSPDGQWVVYSQRLPVGYRLWRMRIDGTGKLALGAASNDVGDELDPTVSPDGRYVAYVADAAGRRTLRVRRFDGGGDRELLDSGDGLLPAW